MRLLWGWIEKKEGSAVFLRVEFGKVKRINFVSGYNDGACNRR